MCLLRPPVFPHAPEDQIRPPAGPTPVFTLHLKAFGMTSLVGGKEEQGMWESWEAVSVREGDIPNR